MLAIITRLATAFPASERPVVARAQPPLGSPPIFYGTAWKKERTRELVLQALRAGFRAIDTACQPKHYSEELVGAGVADAIAQGVIASRADVHLQTKFTPIHGQDPARVPYDASASLEEQVRQSVAASLSNLRTSYVDCLVLHSPLPTHQETMTAWREMERHVASGEVRALGVSNCYDAAALSKLHAEADVKPSVLQNRFYAETRHDTDVRRFCRSHGIAYQSFWTLTGNKNLVQGRAVRAVAKAHECTPEQAWLAFVRGIGCVPLSGTTSAEHMRHDLELPALSDAEIARLAALIG